MDLPANMTEDEKAALFCFLKKLRQTPFGKITVSVKDRVVIDFVTEERWHRDQPPAAR